VISLWAVYNKTPVGGELAVRRSEYVQSFPPKAAGQLAGGPGRAFTSAEGRGQPWQKRALPTEKLSHFRSSFPAPPSGRELQAQLREALQGFKDRNGPVLGNRYAQVAGASIYSRDFVPTSPADRALASVDMTLFAGPEHFKIAGQPRLGAAPRASSQVQTTYRAHHVDFHVRLCDCDPQARPPRSAAGSHRPTH
jgi:hypothetical protein